MPIYEFPPKMSRSEKQAKALHDLQEHKKMRSNMYRNIILAAVIFAISFAVKVVIIKILLILISVGNASVAVLLYKYYALSRDTKVSTKIFEDHFEHSQPEGFSGAFLHSKIFFEDIERSEQNTRGRLVVKLKEGYKSEFSMENRNGAVSEFTPADNLVNLYFPDTQSKLKLVEDFYEQIKYPHKEYNVINDEDDYYSEEDLKWDRLHKHGL